VVVSFEVVAAVGVEIPRIDYAVDVDRVAVAGG
jgi:hypothetical protein